MKATAIHSDMDPQHSARQPCDRSVNVHLDPKESPLLEEMLHMAMLLPQNSSSSLSNTVLHRGSGMPLD